MLDVLSEFDNVVLILCLISVLIMSAHAIVQYDLKKIIAYSSISHMSLSIASLFSNNALGIIGGSSLMLGHSISSAFMFFQIGLLYNRYHSRNVKYYSGIFLIMPIYSFCLFAAMFVNSGLPLTINFIPEFLSFVGVVNKDLIIGGLMSINVFQTPVYSLILLQKVVFGRLSSYINYAYQDLTSKEFYLSASFLAFSLILGIFPNIFLHFLNYYIL